MLSFSVYSPVGTRKFDITLPREEPTVEALADVIVQLSDRLSVVEGQLAAKELPICSTDWLITFDVLNPENSDRNYTVVVHVLPDGVIEHAEKFQKVGGVFFFLLYFDLPAVLSAGATGCHGRPRKRLLQMRLNHAGDEGMQYRSAPIRFVLTND